MRWLITGGNRGIGLEFARQLSARGDEVFVTARDPAASPALRALADASPRVHVLTVDVTRHADRAALAASFADGGLDVLVLNAGVFGARSGLDKVDLDDVAHTLAVNAVAPLGVLAALLPALRRGSAKRVVAVSSGLGSISDNTSGGYHGYRMSKAALNMAMRSSALDLAGEGFVCIAMNPGWVQTDMGGSSAPLTVDASVRNMLDRIDALTPQDNGTFLDHKGGTLPW